eukprot:NODE_188_length_15619_cov_0.374871.p1 type:complete len:1000 gc:universal NODE_188_length_15619_cov_0.374871:10634-7635(-)
MENESTPQRFERSSTSFRGRPNRPNYSNVTPYQMPFRPMVYPNSNYNQPQDDSEELNKLKIIAKQKLEDAAKKSKVIQISDGPPSTSAIKFSDSPTPKAKEPAKLATQNESSKTVKIESKPVAISSAPSKAILIESGPVSRKPDDVKKQTVVKPLSKQDGQDQPQQSSTMQRPRHQEHVPRPQYPATGYKSENQQFRQNRQDQQFRPKHEQYRPRPDQKQVRPQPDKKQHPAEKRDLQPVKSTPQTPVAPNWANIASRNVPLTRPVQKSPPLVAPQPVVKAVDVPSKPPASKVPVVPVKSESPKVKSEKVEAMKTDESESKDDIRKSAPVVSKPSESKKTFDKPGEIAEEKTKTPSEKIIKSPEAKSSNLSEPPRSPIRESKPSWRESSNPIPEKEWRNDDLPVPVVPKVWRQEEEDANHEEDPDNELTEEIVNFLTEWNDHYQTTHEKQPRPFACKLVYSIHYLSRMRDNESPPPVVDQNLHLQLFTNLSMRKKQKIFKNKRRGGQQKKRFTETELLAQQLGLTGNLSKSKNRWDPKKQAVDLEAKLNLQLTGFLNKLTKENYESISTQISDLIVKEPSHAKITALAKNLFAKAVLEPHFVLIYAELCKLIYDQLDTNAKGNVKFSQFLFEVLAQTCQSNFENRPKWTELQSVIEKSGQTTGQDISEDEMAIIYMKKKALGNIQFVGALFQFSIISGNIIFTVLTYCLLDMVEDDIELAIVLLHSTGYIMQSYLKTADPKYQQRYVQIFNKIKELSRDKRISSRVRFMCLDVLDKKKRGFADASGPKKLADVNKPENRPDSRPGSARGPQQQRGSYRRDDRRDQRGSFRGRDKDSNRGSFRRRDDSNRSFDRNDSSRSFESNVRSYERNDRQSNKPTSIYSSKSKPTQQVNKFDTLRKSSTPNTPVPKSPTSSAAKDDKKDDVGVYVIKFKANFKEFVRSDSNVDLIQFLEEVPPAYGPNIAKEWLWAVTEVLPERVCSLMVPFKHVKGELKLGIKEW